MKKRCLMLLALIAVTGCAVIGVLAMLPDHRPGETNANCDRIQKGMGQEDVEALFGRPPDATKPPDRIRGLKLYWIDQDWSSGAVVTLDGDAKVWESKWADGNDGIGRKFRRWIRWPWW
jgi:hypothetical protein